jgi:Xaa-Pro aminopeptidase
LNHRLERLRAQMKQQGLEALFITRAPNRQYITGFTGSAGVVLVTATQAILIVDTRYTIQAKEQAPTWEVIEFQRHNELIPTLNKACQRAGITRLGFEAEGLTFAEYQYYKNGCREIDWIPTHRIMESLRIVKDDQELAVLRHAAVIADQAFGKILEEVRPGLTERQIAARLEFFLRDFGASSSSFDMIVASGVRSALPHGVASDKVLEKGDLVTFDFGALYNGYISDVTRTIVLGKPSAKQKEIYEIVLDAQLKGIAAVRPGIPAREVDLAARNHIESKGYGQYFGHSTGHGIGLEVHEAPSVTTRSEEVLTPGMVITVEPGIYLPGFGGVRIEDDVLVTDSGAEVFTHCRKDLIIID